MKLNKIEIKNYRSIKELTIIAEPSCQVFVGEIEAGKSNILNAISLLDPNNKTINKDVREGKAGENVEESWVKHFLKLDSNEIEVIIEMLESHVYPNSKNATTKIISKLHNVIKNSDVVVVNNCKTLEKDIDFIIPEISFEERWKVLLEDTAETSELFNKDGEAVDFSQYYIFDSKEITAERIKDFEDLNEETLRKIILDLYGDELQKNIPHVIKWQYDSKYLLPSTINKEEFRKNPEMCLPLKRMFELQGINDIDASIQEAQEKGKNRLINLLKHVAEETTKHFISVWPDYKNVEFALGSDGDDFTISIKDTYNNYDLSDRSDGFKRLATFLLLVSISNATDKMNNSIIIVDEPEISLHIKGQRYLMNELLRIANKNHVFYSTHSIFMIDRKNVDRHFIVKKSKEVTFIEKVEASNYIDEEVVFNALGYSLFQSLKNKNIIFEGWTDKELYERAVSRIPREYKDSLSDLKKTGTVFASGVKDVQHICKILDLADREYIVISDSDDPAQEQQKAFEKQVSGKWYTYKQLYSAREVATSEDFIKPERIIRAVKHIARVHDIDIIISEDELLNPSGGRLKVIAAGLYKQELKKEIVKQYLSEVKRDIFNDLKQSDIEDDYYDMLLNVAVLTKECK